MVWADSADPDQFKSTSERSPVNDMQNAPPVLPSRGAASIHCSARARSTRPASSLLYVANAVRTQSMPSFHESEVATSGSGATRSHQGRPPEWPCSRALVRIQRRKSGSASATADCIASNVARLTLLANNEASRGASQWRRRLTVLASPLIAFIAAATDVATSGQAVISAS